MKKTMFALAASSALIVLLHEALVLPLGKEVPLSRVAQVVRAARRLLARGLAHLRPWQGRRAAMHAAHVGCSESLTQHEH